MKGRAMITFMYILIIFILSVSYLNISGLFLPILDSVGISQGYKSIFYQCLLLGVCSIVFIRSKSIVIISKRLCWLSILWLPWLIYLGLRCNFSDPYSVQKLALVFGLEFLSLICICVAYINDVKRFKETFFICTILLSIVLLFVFILNPTRWLYGGIVERLDIENINSVNLARSFAIGAVCLLLYTKLPKWLRYIAFALFVCAIVPTGSRGPLISVLAVLAVYLGQNYLQSYRSVILGLVLACALLPILAMTFYYYQQPIMKYFSRGSGKSMFIESGRWSVVKSVIDEFSSAPVVGVGLGNFGRTSEESRKAIGYSYLKDKKNNIFIRQAYPHNILYEVLAELGLVGMVLFLMILTPGKWVLNVSNEFVLLFVLNFLFSLSSSDITGNSGLFMFNYLAVLSSNYGLAEEPVT